MTKPTHRTLDRKQYTEEEAKLVMDKLCQPTNFCYAPMTVLKKGKKKRGGFFEKPR